MQSVDGCIKSKLYYLKADDVKTCFIKLVRIVKKKKSMDYSGTSIFGSQCTKASPAHQLLLHHALIGRIICIYIYLSTYAYDYDYMIMTIFFYYLYWKRHRFGFRSRWQHCLCRSFVSVTLIDRRLWPQGVLARPQSRWHQYHPHNHAVSSEDAIRSSLSTSQLTLFVYQ